MPDPNDTNNDIGALLRHLDNGVWPEAHAALTALVADRDALRKERQMYWESCDALERQHLDLRAELAAMQKQRDEARDYSIALQRAIEHHSRGVEVPPEIAILCPHHAQMLNQHLASREGGGA